MALFHWHKGVRTRQRIYFCTDFCTTRKCIRVKNSEITKANNTQSFSKRQSDKTIYNPNHSRLFLTRCAFLTCKCYTSVGTKGWRNICIFLQILWQDGFARVTSIRFKFTEKTFFFCDLKSLLEERKNCALFLWLTIIRLLQKNFFCESFIIGFSGWR